MIRILMCIVLSILIFLQYKLWFDGGAIPSVWVLRTHVQDEKNKLKLLRKQNHALLAEVRNLKQATEAIEERARSDLGMIRSNESFYQYVDPAQLP